MMRGVFVTGTDTGVGKTLAACALIHALAARGVAATPMKPIAAGADLVDGRYLNVDTRALLEAAGCDLSLAEDATPILLREAMAPHIAAANEARTITLEPVIAAFERVSSTGRFVVVEGVGGFRVPLGEGLDSVDLARALGLPMIVVVGLRLGCLNHALLTVQAIEAAGLTLAGWIANTLDPGMPAIGENIQALTARIAAPLLGRLDFMRQPEPRALAASLDVGPLLSATR
jgi:dethiobiotin synthetase